jgi:hypothetical protein
VRNAAKVSSLARVTEAKQFVGFVPSGIDSEKCHEKAHIAVGSVNRPSAGCHYRVYGRRSFRKAMPPEFILASEAKILPGMTQAAVEARLEPAPQNRNQCGRALNYMTNYRY